MLHWSKANLPALTPCLSRFIPRANDVVFTQAPTHYELLISKIKHRAIRETEVENSWVLLKRKIDLQIIDQSAIKTPLLR